MFQPDALGPQLLFGRNPAALGRVDALTCRFEQADVASYLDNDALMELCQPGLGATQFGCRFVVFFPAGGAGDD